MTTRRRAMGAILGGVAAGPEAVKRAVTSLPSLRAAVPMVGYAPQSQPPPMQPMVDADYVARLRRIASGNPEWEDIMGNGYGQYCAHLQHVEALRSISPVARHLIVWDHTIKRARKDAIERAIKQLASMGFR